LVKVPAGVFFDKRLLDVVFYHKEMGGFARFPIFSFLGGIFMNVTVNIAKAAAPSSFAPAVKRRQEEELPSSFNSRAWGVEVKRFASSLPGSNLLKNTEAEVSRLEKISLAFNKRLQFVVNHESNEVTVNVIDPDTDKVIKVLPPEELQRLHGKLEEALGFLFDEKV
jgi:flagellar protein FlaG